MNQFAGHSVHFPPENIDSTAIFAVFSGKVNHFSANQWHFPPNMRLSASVIFGYAGNTVAPRQCKQVCSALGFCAICLRQKHCCASAMQTSLLCSRLLRYSATPETLFTPRQLQTSLLCSRLLRYSATPEIRFTPRQCKPDGLHYMFRPLYP